MFRMHEFCLVFLKEFLTLVGLLNESKGLFGRAPATPKMALAPAPLVELELF
jgi:hypothetical protein